VHLLTVGNRKSTASEPTIRFGIDSLYRKTSSATVASWDSFATDRNGGRGVAHSSDFDASVSSLSVARVRLTTLERDALTVSATGRTSAQVASDLDVSIEAVRDALGSAIVKIGARSKLEAVIIALRDGLIDLPPS
jgi:DNA-binding CsgD family transcriptional regulator